MNAYEERYAEIRRLFLDSEIDFRNTSKEKLKEYFNNYHWNISYNTYIAVLKVIDDLFV